jgi:hypothetical protein
MSARRPAGTPRANIVRGVWRVASGRADGLAQFGHTPQAFLASLAPLIAFPLVLAGLVAAEGGGLAPLYRLLATACLLLAPPVLSHALARFWGREPFWLHFATAFNWCQWAIPVAASLVFLLVDALMALGLPRETAGLLMPYALTAYALWLHWFLMRHGLQVSGLRAVVGTMLVNIGTGLLFVGPGLIRLLLDGGQGGGR